MGQGLIGEKDSVKKKSKKNLYIPSSTKPLGHISYRVYIRFVLFLFFVYHQQRCGPLGFPGQADPSIFVTQLVGEGFARWFLE